MRTYLIHQNVHHRKCKTLVLPDKVRCFQDDFHAIIFRVLKTSYYE